MNTNDFKKILERESLTQKEFEKNIRATKNQRGISELQRWWKEKRLDS